MRLTSALMFGASLTVVLLTALLVGGLLNSAAIAVCEATQSTDTCHQTLNR